MKHLKNNFLLLFVRYVLVVVLSAMPTVVFSVGIINVVTNGVDNNQIDDGVIAAADGGLVNFSISANAIEAFDGNIVMSSMGAIFLDEVISKGNGGLFFTPGTVLSINRGLGSLSLDIIGGTIFNSGLDVFAALNVSTLAQQVYDGNVVIMESASVSLQAALNDIVFKGTVDGDEFGRQNLELNANNVIFNANVGNINPLESLKVDVNGDISIREGGAIITAGNQNFNGDLELLVDTVLSTANAVSEVVLRKVNGAQDLTVNNAGQSIKLLGSIGGNIALGNFTLSTNGNILLANNASVTTTGDQTYFGDVLLNHRIELGGDVTNLAGNNITFDGKINVKNSIDAFEKLKITVAGIATFNDRIGNVNKLEELSVYGASKFNGDKVVTRKEQNYAGNVVIGSDIEFEVQDNNEAVVFGAALDDMHMGIHNVKVNGNAIFNGVVGGVSALKSLTVMGKTAINGGAITTTDGQLYKGAVVLNASPVIVLPLPGVVTFPTVLDAGMGQVWFEDTLDGIVANTEELVIESAARFDGVVGGNNRLESLTVNGAAIVNANITVDRFQQFNGGLNIANNAVLKAVNPVPGPGAGPAMCAGAGCVAVKGVLRIGNSPGSATIDASLEFDNSTWWEVEIGGTEFAEFDSLSVTGTAALAGRLDISLIDPLEGSSVFAPGSGDIFDILTADTIEGVFSSVFFPSEGLLSAGLIWELKYLQDYNGTTTDIVRLEVSSVPLPASIWLFSAGILGLVGVSRRR